MARAVHRVALPIGDRLQEARHMWRFVSEDVGVQGVVDQDYRIRWSGEWPQVPHKSKNPPTSEDDEKIPC